MRRIRRTGVRSGRTFDLPYVNRATLVISAPAATIYFVFTITAAVQPSQAHSGVTSFKPTIPTTISATQISRRASALSWKSAMPTRTVPIVPIPVHTA